MGMDQTATFGGGAFPPWPAVRDLLARHGFPVQVRMIDGELAFPDEEPAAGWRELRLGTPQGMVTVRREGERAVFVTWGNADAALVQAWNAVAWAFAAAGGGTIAAPDGPRDADDFFRRADLPAPLRASAGPPP
jgi:hypothetical protein